MLRVAHHVKSSRHLWVSLCSLALTRFSLECDEMRIFAGRCADNPEAIRALPIPSKIKQLCE